MGQEMLRKKLEQCCCKDAKAVVNCLKSAGVMLSKKEEECISCGDLSAFSDAQLAQRFNPKVCGMLGISGMEQSGKQQPKKKM